MPEQLPRTGSQDWHSREGPTVCLDFNTGPEGLSDAEAELRLISHGANAGPAHKARGPLRRFLAQFNGLLIQVLLVASVITAALGHWTDSGVILAVCVLNAVIGFAQEGKAERALDAIRGMLSPQANVVRAGRRRAVAAADVVPGDVVLLESGDRVTADLRLLRARGLRIQQAVLTGESVAVDKSIEPVPPDAPLGDRRSMAYSGTVVAAGQGAAVVVATGMQTEIGRISTLLASVEPLMTPLLAKVAAFARWLTGLVLASAILVFAVGVLLRGLNAADMFIAVVSLAVAAIPEGLPTILTVSLAIGVTRMAKRHAIIRRLPAVETLGSVSIICTDKTGTLTRNEMVAKAVAVTAGVIEVEGVGYERHGSLRYRGRDLLDSDEVPGLREVALVATLCNDAHLRQPEDGCRVEGDPMEGARSSCSAARPGSIQRS